MVLQAHKIQANFAPAVQAIARDFSIRCAGKAQKLTSTSGLFRRQSDKIPSGPCPTYRPKQNANAQAESLVRLMNTTDTLITAPRVLSAAAVFLRVEGPKSRNITVDGGDFSKTEKPLAFADGADEGAGQAAIVTPSGYAEWTYY